MAGLVDLINSLTPWHWFLFGVALIALEVMVTTTFLLWPGISAILVAALTALFPIPGGVALILFAVLGVGSTLVWQKYLSEHHTTSDHPELNRRALQYVGRKAVLRESLVDGFGYLTLDDTRWRIESEDGSNIQEGTRVEVISVEGNSFHVRPVNAETASS